MHRHLVVLLSTAALFAARSRGDSSSSSYSGPFVELTSDSPAVLDAPLAVTADLINVNQEDGPFVFSFSDDASPMHYKEVKSSNLTAVYVLTYPSDEYVQREYAITCRVYIDRYIYREEVAKKTVYVSIKKNLSGFISVEQANQTVTQKRHVATIQTKVMSQFEVHLYDPSGFFNASEVLYFWFINDTSYGTTNSASFLYNFTSPGRSTIEVFVVAKKSDIIPSHLHTSMRTLNTSRQIQNVVVPKDIKTGMFRVQVDARNPMNKVKVDGDIMLKHGLLLNLTVSCDGTGPWTYCWSIKGPSYNSTGNETCDDGYETTSTCNFPIVWYLRNPGQSAVLIVIDNVLNHIVKQVGINVYDVPSRTPVSLIVIPMCSGLIAVIACISGVFVFMTFKRNMTGLETADFDFSCPDEQLEYKTFWERLRDSMVNALSNSHKDDESHVSSVSSRSVQGPPVGIHYGSIT